MNKTIKHGIYTNNPRSIRAVLEGWIATQKYYIKEEDDLPWWYNERASISILASAAWKIGNVALEEYSTIKGRHSEDKKSGRCDLYFTSGDNYFACEAKQAWISSGSKIRKPIKDKINESLEGAIDNVSQLQKHEGRRLAICFAVPHFPMTDKNNLDTLVRNFIKSLPKTAATAYAYYFISHINHDCEGNDGRLYPGNAILIKEIKRRRKSNTY